MKFAGIEVPEGADPELMQLIGQELQRRIEIEAVIAEREQIELAQIYHSQPVQRAIDGVGPQIMAISPTLYLHYRVQEQLDFTSSKDRHWLMQRFPEIKVPGKQTVKDSFGWVPGMGSAAVPGGLNAPSRRDAGAPAATTISPSPARNVRETISYQQPQQN